MSEQNADDSDINYIKEAAKVQYNWIALAGAAGFALVSGSALPLLLAAGLELMYLSVVPQTSRFQRLVRSWKYAEEKRRDQSKLSALFQEIPPEMRLRYADLDKVCNAIRANYVRLSATSQIFTKQMEEKLQSLLQAYLRLLHAAFQHREYLRTTDLKTIQKEISELQKGLDSDPPKVQEINRKRIEILSKRLQKFEKIRENREVIDAQCAAIEDVLELIRDQSVTMRDPQFVSDHLENLVQEVEHTEATVREMEAIFEMPAPEISSSSTPSGRTRVRG